VYLKRTGCVLSLLIALAACDRLPESYPPPQQRSLEAVDLGRDAMMVSMEGSAADQSIVKDIYGGGTAPWRWTKQNPTVRALVLATKNVKYSADFAIWDESFKVTGPLQISFFVNGRLLDRVRETTPGEKHFEKPVPDGWLTMGSEATVALSVDKIYVAPRDHAVFGVILTRMGLKQ
jgi:hypothetical protein